MFHYSLRAFSKKVIDIVGPDIAIHFFAPIRFPCRLIIIRDDGAMLSKVVQSTVVMVINNNCCVGSCPINDQMTWAGQELHRSLRRVSCLK